MESVTKSAETKRSLPTADSPSAQPFKKLDVEVVSTPAGEEIAMPELTARDLNEFHRTECSSGCVCSPLFQCLINNTTQTNDDDYDSVIADVSDFITLRDAIREKSLVNTSQNVEGRIVGYGNPFVSGKTRYQDVLLEDTDGYQTRLRLWDQFLPQYQTLDKTLVRLKRVRIVDIETERHLQASPMTAMEFIPIESWSQTECVPLSTVNEQNERRVITTLGIVMSWTDARTALNGTRFQDIKLRDETAMLNLRVWGELGFDEELLKTHPVIMVHSGLVRKFNQNIELTTQARTVLEVNPPTMKKRIEELKKLLPAEYM